MASEAHGGRAALAIEQPELALLSHGRMRDFLVGEAQVEQRLAAAVRRGEVAALAGWCPAADVEPLARRLAPAGAAVVPLPVPRGQTPPTRLRGTGRVRRSLSPLVTTYGTVPYADLDPTSPAGVVYALMFGLMFGDAGHGALLILAALVLRSGRPRKLAKLRPLWPFVAGCGLAATLAGVAYGEFFGPTGVLPALWLDPLDSPARLVAAAVVLGSALIGVACVAGTVNRRREGGLTAALYSAQGGAGLALWAGLVVAAAGMYARAAAMTACGLFVAAAGLALLAVGSLAAGPGGAGGVAQTGVELLDATVRIAANTVSFARLAAFGLTHAAIGQVVWQGTSALADRGGLAVVGAALLFTTGNTLAFCLEALVAGVQALRLEYYELFSRVFAGLGRPFRPWAPPVRRLEVDR